MVTRFRSTERYGIITIIFTVTCGRLTCCAFFVDGFSLHMSHIPIVPLRYLTITIMIVLSIGLSGATGAAQLKVLLLLICITLWILFHYSHHPYEQQYFEPMTLVTR